MWPVQKVDRIYEAIDWYVIRKSAPAWHFRAQYYLAAVTVALGVSLLLPLLPSTGKQMAYVMLVPFTLVAAHIWFHLTFIFVEHAYDENGFAPFLLFMFLAFQPWVIIGAQVPALLAAPSSLASIAVWYGLSFHTHRLIAFRMVPEPYSSRRVKMWTYLTIVVGAAMIAFLVAVVLASGLSRQTTPGLSPAALDLPVDGLLDNLDTLDNRVGGATAGAAAATEPVVERSTAVDNIRDAVTSALDQVSRNIGSRPSQISVDSWITLGLAGGAVLAAVGFVIVFFRVLIAPLFDFDIHRRLFARRADKTVTFEFENRLLRHWFAVPIAVIAGNFIAELSAAPAWSRSGDVVAQGIAEATSLTWPAILLLSCYLVLAVRAFQPELNYIRARAG